MQFSQTFSIKLSPFLQSNKMCWFLYFQYSILRSLRRFFLQQPLQWSNKWIYQHWILKSDHCHKHLPSRHRPHHCRPICLTSQQSRHLLHNNASHNNCACFRTELCQYSSSYKEFFYENSQFSYIKFTKFYWTWSSI